MTEHKARSSVYWWSGSDSDTRTDSGRQFQTDAGAAGKYNASPECRDDDIVLYLLIARRCL